MYNYEHNHVSTILFKDCQIGDLVKFKDIKESDKDKMKRGIYVEEKYSTYYATVVDVSSKSHLGININPKDKRLDYPNGLTIWIDRRSILQIYPQNIIPHLTPRLSLKHIWQDLIFREVKTIKCKNLKYVRYNYINKSGLNRIKQFKNLEEALRNINLDQHKNISQHFDEYYGFTSDKAIRNNDKYYDQEIFFSKKCYCELDLSETNPTGDFILNYREYSDIAPRAGSLICGLVEKGEKGLFFRKWFVCSRQFLTLWTMVCEPKDSSLKKIDNSNISFEHLLKNEVSVREKSKEKLKSLDMLLEELDTSCYQINFNLDISERQKRYVFQNLEKVALFFPNRYKKICNLLFENGFLKKEDSYGASRSYSEDEMEDFDYFQKKFIKNIMWSSRMFN